MKLEDQVLSIKQVRELQELGFDVEKHSSMCWVAYTSDEEPYEKEYSLSILDEFCYESASLEPIPTMSIGDIINVLPEKIKTYSANADKEIYFYLRLNNAEILYIPLITDDFIGCCCSNEDKLINNLFNTIVWCIKEKHIKL